MQCIVLMGGGEGEGGEEQNDKTPKAKFIHPKIMLNDMTSSSSSFASRHSVWVAKYPYFNSLFATTHIYDICYGDPMVRRYGQYSPPQVLNAEEDVLQ